MSEGAPDISRIINLIMENPKLIEEITALAKKDAAENADADSKSDLPTNEEIEDKNSKSIKGSAEPTYPGVSGNKNRARLLSAFKPYLSGQRAKAVDSIITIADILDVMKSR